MALIIETGSIVSGANSYADVDFTRAYAVARGLTLPESDGDLEVLLVKGMDFIEAMEDQMQGARVSKYQELSWPRSGVTINGFELDEDAIPLQLKRAQAQLAAEAVGNDLMPSGTGRIITREKLDVIETEYAVTGSSAPVPTFARVNALLAPLLDGGSSGLTMTHV